MARTRTNGRKRSESKALRISHVTLVNWRNFQRAFVTLQRRVFLVGPNASGKSNFLDAFRFLRDIVSVGGGLQEALRRRGGISRLRCLSARQYSDIQIEVAIGSSDSGSEWSYRLIVNQDTKRRGVIKSEVVWHGAETVLIRPDEKDRSDPERLTQTYLEQVNANQDFRDVAKFFGSIKYLHLVPQLVREPDRSIGRANDPFGGDFLEQVARTTDKTRSARLRRINEALRTAVPQLKQLELWRDDRGTPHLRGKYEHWRPEGAWQTEEDLSDGTLRLLGLLWAVLDGTGPLLLEEPELSLHPEVVRLLPQLFARMQRRSGRQIMTSTHSPDLLKDSGIGLDEVLLLFPEPEGTSVRLAADFDDVRSLLEGGVTLADALIPKTKPAGIEQLTLFGD